jgi:hypothetical protein
MTNITKIRIEIADGVITDIYATGPVSIQVVDHDFPDGHNAVYNNADVVTWQQNIAESECIDEHTFDSTITYKQP